MEFKTYRKCFQWIFYVNEECYINIVDPSSTFFCENCLSNLIFHYYFLLFWCFLTLASPCSRFAVRNISSDLLLVSFIPFLKVYLLSLIVKKSVISTEFSFLFLTQESFLNFLLYWNYFLHTSNELPEQHWSDLEKSKPDLFEVGMYQELWQEVLLWSESIRNFSFEGTVHAGTG